MRVSSGLAKCGGKLCRRYRDGRFLELLHHNLLQIDVCEIPSTRYRCSSEALPCYAPPLNCLKILSWHRSRMVEGLIGSIPLLLRVFSLVWYEAFLSGCSGSFWGIDLVLNTRAV